jgi:hypothetical protein
VTPERAGSAVQASTSGRHVHYTGGIVDALRCVGMIRSSNLPTRNRLAFLTLDSTLEISMRLFLRYRKGVTLDPVKHRSRYVLLGMVKKKLKLEDALWDQLTYCYDGIRCPLYHEASDMTLTDVMLDDFQETVAFLITEMFRIDAASAIAEGVPSQVAVVPPDPSQLWVNHDPKTGVNRLRRTGCRHELNKHVTPLKGIEEERYDGGWHPFATEADARAAFPNAAWCQDCV